MKNILLSIFSIMVIGTITNATDKNNLSDFIYTKCSFYNEEIPFDERENCMIYYINCTVRKNGKHTDKDLFKCVKDR